jgi:queuine/archaeosine tRNA-ribosyltransferase
MIVSTQELEDGFERQVAIAIGEGHGVHGLRIALLERLNQLGFAMDAVGGTDMATEEADYDEFLDWLVRFARIWFRRCSSVHGVG